jgi:succinate dehydrogenase / fumarate reductase, iron-sulfur subunit
MKMRLKIWMQDHQESEGQFEVFDMEGLSEDMSLMEMLDLLNEARVKDGLRPVEFDHDCREGICGTCGFMINGMAHGNDSHMTVCQVHLRQFGDGDELVLEPFRSGAFPLRRDLSIDRSAFDRIIMAGGFISVSTGEAPEANSIPISRENAESAMDAAACIGCGACVASCVNGSASLFTAAKLVHLVELPQGRVESTKRAASMYMAMEQEGFGHCSFTGSCEAQCPQSISINHIARMQWELLKGSIF